jgi:hypothetical protein
MTRAGEFDGDLRRLPKTKQPDRDAPPVRESDGKPIAIPTPTPH